MSPVDPDAPLGDPSTLLAVLAQRTSRPRVLIVGDLILDRYVTGGVTRISPEAPIPVLTVREQTDRLGGAGNVAANLLAMEADVGVLGVVGEDEFGRRLLELLAAHGADTAGVAVDATRPTILKARMMSGVQQMLRVDWEDARPIGEAARARLLGRLDAELERSSAVVLSDYGKGVLTTDVLRRVIDACRARGVPVLVDPKGEDYTRYRGATLMTPNRREAEQALGRELSDLAAVEEGARELIELAELDATVITLGAEGIYYRTRDGRSGHVPARAHAVFDVTGAGDTVVAQLALYLAERVDLHDAVRLANRAAGIVVEKLGTHAVSRAELEQRLRSRLAHRGKVCAPHELDALVAGWRRAGLRVVLTNGCFDVLHVGHLEYLRFSRAQGDRLLIGVNDDASVARLKGPTRPVNPVEDRMAVLTALEMVDAVVPFGEDTPARLVEAVSPDVLVKGEDWADKGVVGREWVEAHGGRVVLAPLVPGRSTTSILARARGEAPQ